MSSIRHSKKAIKKMMYKEFGVKKFNFTREMIQKLKSGKNSFDLVIEFQKAKTTLG